MNEKYFKLSLKNSSKDSAKIIERLGNNYTVNEKNLMAETDRILSLIDNFYNEECVKLRNLTYQSEAIFESIRRFKKNNPNYIYYFTFESHRTMLKSIGISFDYIGESPTNIESYTFIYNNKQYENIFDIELAIYRHICDRFSELHSPTFKNFYSRYEWLQVA